MRIIRWWWGVPACLSLFAWQAHAQLNPDSYVASYAELSATVTVKATKGPLLWWSCKNTNATDAWVQLFDIPGTVTLGTTVPNRSLQVAANSLSGVQAPSPSFSYANSLQVAATTTPTGSTPPVAGLTCDFWIR